MSKRSLLLIVGSLLLLLAGIASIAIQSGSRKLDLHPFDPSQLDTIAAALLAYRHQHGTLPSNSDSLTALLVSHDDQQLASSAGAFLLSDAKAIQDLDGGLLEYERLDDQDAFRITSAGTDRLKGTDDDFTVKGRIARDGLILMAVVRGDRDAYRPAEELLFLSTFEQRLLPALERYFDDSGHYPCIFEWKNHALLQRTSGPHCRNLYCGIHGTSAATSRGGQRERVPVNWNGPYLDGPDARACMRGPFEDALSYHELAEGQGFSIYVGAIEGLMLLEGSLNVVRLRFAE